MLWLDPSRVSADGNNLRYAGRVGTGFTHRTLDELYLPTFDEATPGQIGQTRVDDRLH